MQPGEVQSLWVENPGCAAAARGCPRPGSRVTAPSCRDDTATQHRRDPFAECRGSGRRHGVQRGRHGRRRHDHELGPDRRPGRARQHQRKGIGITLTGNDVLDSNGDETGLRDGIYGNTVVTNHASGGGNVTFNITGGSAVVLGDIEGGTGSANKMTIAPGAGSTFATTRASPTSALARPILCSTGERRRRGA